MIWVRSLACLIPMNHPRGDHYDRGLCPAQLPNEASMEDNVIWMAMYSKSSAHNMCFQGISNLLIPPKGHGIAVPFGEYQIPGKQEVHVIEKKWAIFPLLKIG